MSGNIIPERSVTSNRERYVKSGETLNKQNCEKNMPFTHYFEDMFLFKEKEREEKEREKVVNRNRKVHEKTTFASRMKNRSHLAEINIPSASVSQDVGLDSTFILNLVDRTADAKKSIQEFIHDQRERFMLEYTLATKRKMIMELQRSMEKKEQQLLNAEKRLQEDAIAFEEFLRENDQKSVDALKIAAQETIAKLQMASEVKKANLEIHFVKSEIMKTELLLKEYIKYGCFLLKISPKTWQVQQALKKMKSRDNSLLPTLVARQSTGKKSKLDTETLRKFMGLEDELLHNTRSRETLYRPKSMTNQEDIRKSFQETRGSDGPSFRRKKTLEVNLQEDGRKIKKSTFDQKRPTPSRTASFSSEESFDLTIDETECDLEPELYFKEPQELLQVLSELEEQNLTLVQYSQDVDETLDDVSKREKIIQDKVNSSIEALMDQKEMLRNNCAREEEKAAELELRSRLFNFGEFNSEIQEKLIESLSKKVNQVYKFCIGEVDIANLSPVQKLVKVESRLVELSDLIESVPKENIELIEKAKQRERRQKMREDKMREKLKSQEEKIRIALERAVSQPKKKMGRKLVFRSQPVTDIKQEIQYVDESKAQSLEDQYFFS